MPAETAIANAFIDAEIKHAELFFELASEFGESLPTMIERYALARVRSPLDHPEEVYQDLHDHEKAYQTNNWLIPALQTISGSGASSVIEIGCGNCKFSAAIAESATKVTAIDWAKAPGVAALPSNAEFLQANFVSEAIPTADLICSADVLEHIAFESMEPLIKKLSLAAPLQYHTIACYDDGHSHLTVMHPGAWLAMFQLHIPDAKLINVECRRGDKRQLNCTITNIVAEPTVK
ncbi:hypothetical protein SJ05684_b52780 (plasmid) [Sinorhizobium sojae CCBAU 05684]|uniref:Methyltransferase domain-containing protein n=1 Tax=Sinorhizobium sojae CCBAU 05684 TaxID=716928 RepID=A0A249PJY5_9HYPH|nr:class I SAM-dependent methyltransferase [Sinorhizobium sojae]ASY66260.1 hypothetical protein SJ05684_b52780 [Sinorhizobium sojae CCBAU 05684]